MIKGITMKRPPVIKRIIPQPVVEARSRRRGRRRMVAFSSTGPLQLFHAHPLVAIHWRRGRWKGALKRRVVVRITKRRPHWVVREPVTVVIVVKFIELSPPAKVVQFIQKLPLSTTHRLGRSIPLSTLIWKENKTKRLSKVKKRRNSGGDTS